MLFYENLADLPLVCRGCLVLGQFKSVLPRPAPSLPRAAHLCCEPWLFVTLPSFEESRMYQTVEQMFVELCDSSCV